MNRSAPTARGAAAGWRIAHVVMPAGWSVRVHDADLVPKTGPVILASNHSGFIDAPLLMGASPRGWHQTGRQWHAQELGKHQMHEQRCADRQRDGKTQPRPERQ